ncbi:protein HAIKU1-like [Phalaenopsis equestris]|uniref:protein HAIKU1-like n=1 Tax=Phalaenopsis equestris TaxID=78828 RepID=UPI0009E2A8E8|nr:protein HAIKU1-like [Phalaenopsis equestris]
MDQQPQHQLGVNKLGRNIRKSPLHQPNLQRLPPAALNEQQQALPNLPRVYNISKSDFRSVVQQLTGSPARDASEARYRPAPAQFPQPKPPSSRLMKIRPPPLTPIPPPPPFQNQIPNPNYNLNPNPAYYRPAPSPSAPGSAVWTESPVSAYMRYLESSLLTSDTYQPQQQPRSQGLLPFPHPAATAAGAFPSPRGMISSSSQPPSQPALLPSPGLQFPLPSPGLQFPLLSPGASFPLPSPNSQFPLPSPSSFLNLLSPKSPYPLLSPRFQYPTPPTPNFFYSPLPQSGILGPGPGFQTLPSPGSLFPQSPSGSRPLLSPRCREM